VENALVLALTPRLMHNGQVPPLGTTGSLAYFVPVIEGMLESRRGKTS
jgi:hypothetical protein